MTAGTVAVALLWAIVLAQFPSQRRVPIRRAVWLVMLILCAIGTLDQPAIGHWLDRAAGLPNGADLAQHVLAVVAITLGRYLTVSIFGSWGERGRPSAARLAVAPGLAIAAMVALFAASPARSQPTDTARYTDFPMQFAAHPAVIAYWLVFTGYLGVSFAVIARLAWRYGRPAARSRVGQGLLLLAGGMVAGLCYLAYGTAVVAARAAGVGGAFISTAPAVIQALFGAVVVLVAAGCVHPAARHWPGVRHVALYWSLRRLYPLWAGLCQAVPGIVLYPVPPWADRLDPRDLRMRLYRRVIEIRDGYLALSPVDAPGIEDSVRAAAGRRRLPAADYPMIVTATRLELARRARLRGDTLPAARLVEAGGTVAGHTDAYRDFLAGTDLDSEVRLLRTVAAHSATISGAAELIERAAS